MGFKIKIPELLILKNHDGEVEKRLEEPVLSGFQSSKKL